MSVCLSACQGDSDVYMSRQQTHGWVKHTAITHAPPGHVCHSARARVLARVRASVLPPLLFGPPITADACSR